MKHYKTIKGYLKAIREVAAKQEVTIMKGYDDLPTEVQDKLFSIIAHIQNEISDIDEILNESAESEVKECDCTHTQACSFCAKDKGIDWVNLGL